MQVLPSAGVARLLAYADARPGPQTLVHAASGVLHRDTGRYASSTVAVKIAIDARAENLLVSQDQF
jgi:hypothetical protein